MSTKKVKALIDNYAGLVLTRQAIDRLINSLRPDVIALGAGEHAGREHLLVVDHTTRASISVAVAKSLLTASQLEAATVVSDVTTIRVEA